MNRRVAVIIATVAVSLVSSGSMPAVAGAQGTRMNVLSKQDQKDGWKLLFDGKTTTGWHTYKKTKVDPGWLIKDGVLSRTADTAVSAGDLLTNNKYRNFDLALDWRISEGGNSGIIYRANEENSYVWQSGVEMQILDDAKHNDGKLQITSAGSAFGLYPAPRGVVHNAGQWNAARILVRGSHVEHGLNGKRLFTYDTSSPDFAARVAASKFKIYPGFGKAPEGYIALQDHGDKVEFRNIRIKVLP